MFSQCRRLMEKKGDQWRVLGADSQHLIEILALCRLRWFGHVLHMSAQILIFVVPFGIFGQGWKRRCGGQAMTKLRGRKKLASTLTSVGSVCLSGWCSGYQDCCQLKMLTNKTKSKSVARVLYGYSVELYFLENNPKTTKNLWKFYCENIE